MIQRLKNLPSLHGKKRYIVLGLLAIELISLPAAAKIVQTVSFTAAPSVIAVEIPTAEPGLSRFLVASDAEFLVEVDDPIGDVNVNIHVSGNLASNVRFGDSAQLPGPQNLCTSAKEQNSEIYYADQATAAKAGSAPERAVVFEFQYALKERPKFEFIAGERRKRTIALCE